MTIKINQLAILDMQCADCENIIEDALQPLPGILLAKADFSTESLELKFDNDIIALNTICAAIKSAGYSCGKYKTKKPTGLLKRLGYISIGLIGMILLFQLENHVDLGLNVGELEQNISYGLLFLVGVLTSFHCIGMCGAFVISYTTGIAQRGRSSHLSHLAYGLGKTISYTAFGALFGLIGASITFTLGLRSMVAGIAGIFLIIYGLSMLDAFAGLRRFHIRPPKHLVHSITNTRRRISNPLAIGLLNGMMFACGPLQAMYILAAGTGSPVEGAKLLFIFALGTLPVMLAFGYMASMITANTTRKLLKTSGILILVLGAFMLNRSLLISGSGYDFNSIRSKISQEIQAHFMTWQHHADAVSHLQNGYQVIYMEAAGNTYQPGEFSLRKNIPVKWVINVKELTYCNKQIIVPSLDMTIDLHEGLQVVEFKPEKSGIISWSCHMGMIPGTFVVKD